MADLRLRPDVGLVEDWRLLELALLLPIASMRDAKPVLEIALDPHLAHNILVKRMVGALEELD